jgi:hypothetical protein
MDFRTAAFGDGAEVWLTLHTEAKIKINRANCTRLVRDILRSSFLRPESPGPRHILLHTAERCRFSLFRRCYRLQMIRFWTVGRQHGMYGPPPCCKRKVKIAGWSAQMYPVFE